MTLTLLNIKKKILNATLILIVANGKVSLKKQDL